jgi:hypothetical protein
MSQDAKLSTLPAPFRDCAAILACPATGGGYGGVFVMIGQKRERGVGARSGSSGGDAV